MSGAITNDYSNNRVQQGPTDSSINSALNSLPPRPAQIGADDLLGAVVSGTKDLDNSAAGLEYTDFIKYARENWDRLSPEAKEIVQTYEKYAKESLAQGQTGIPQDKWDTMVGEMQRIAGVDSSAAAAIRDIEKTSGPISGEQLTDFIQKATSDLDSQAAGTEYHAIMEWAKENSGRLTPEARQVLDRYEAEVRTSQAEGKTGIPQDRYDQMIADMKEIKTYSDASAGVALDGLAHKSGKITGEDMRHAIEQGTKDLDGQAAGTEFHDFMDWAAQNKDRLTPEARQVLDIYEKYTRESQSGGGTGISQENYNKMMDEMKLVGLKHEHDQLPHLKLTAEMREVLEKFLKQLPQDVRDRIMPGSSGSAQTGESPRVSARSTSGDDSGPRVSARSTSGDDSGPQVSARSTSGDDSGPRVGAQSTSASAASGTQSGGGVTRQEIFANVYGQVEDAKNELYAEMNKKPPEQPDQAKIAMLQDQIKQLYNLLELLNKLSDMEHQLQKSIIQSLRV